MFVVNKDQLLDQLKLALAWNRIDVASSMFTGERRWTVSKMVSTMPP